MAPITPSRFRSAALVAGLAQGLIVLTGAAVRLTDAGLGYENWPACTEDRLVPELGFHAWVEFGNRLLSFVVVVTVAVAINHAYRRSPRRRDLILWSWGLAVGTAAQIVLGGITVLVELHPALVGAHYLVSVGLLWNAVVLWVRASAGGAATGPAAPPSIVWHGRAVTSLALVVLVLGTLVTGTGPNSGDSRATRLAFDLTEIARVHAIAVWCLLATVVVLAVRLHRSPRSPRSGPASVVASRGLVAAIVAQGAIGYTQFALGVPPLLVEAHILGSVLVWAATVYLHLSFFRRPAIESDQVDGVIELESTDRSIDDSAPEGVTPAAGLATMET